MPHFWGQAGGFSASYLSFSGSEEVCLWRGAALAAETLPTDWGCEPTSPKSPWSRDRIIGVQGLESPGLLLVTTIASWNR